MRWPWSRKAKNRWRPEFDTLARYNAEKARGVAHAEEWQTRMAELQRQFDAAFGRSGRERDSLPYEI